jgi:hypothetical protein
MGAVGKVPAAIGMAAAIATLALPGPARAQGDDQPPAEAAATTRGFGERGSVLLSLENVFGVLDQTYTGPNNSTSLNDNGFFPQGFAGTKLGIHALLSSGITLGAILGVWGSSGTQQNSLSVTALHVGPRIGWAGCFKRVKTLGFWGRLGPTFQYEHLGLGNISADAWAMDASFEAFMVWSPVDHFGLLAGPSVDIGLTGHQSSNNQGNDWGYHAIGMSLGLVFEL